MIDEQLEFLISQYADPPPPPPPPPPNPAGIPAPEAAAPEVVDLPQVGIRIETPITDVSLQEALEIIVRAAEGSSDGSRRLEPRRGHRQGGVW